MSSKEQSNDDATNDESIEQLSDEQLETSAGGQVKFRDTKTALLKKVERTNPGS